MRREGGMRTVCSLREPASLETGELPVSRAMTYFTGSRAPIKTVKVVLPFKEVRIVRLSQAIDGRAEAKEVNIRETNIAKTVVAIVKCKY